MTENNSKSTFDILRSSTAFHLAGGDESHVIMIEKYIDILLKWNNKVNLTGLRGREAILNRLIIESIEGVEIISSTGNLIDIGSGAGIPGIVIKIFRPDLKIDLVESRVKKAVFLETVIRELELNGIEVLNEKFETLYSKEILRESGYDFLTLRAVRIDRNIARIASDIIRADGLLLKYGSINDAEMKILSENGFRIMSVSHPVAGETAKVFSFICDHGI